MTNFSQTLYIGVASNLRNRIWQHKNKEVEGFTEKYNINKLIYYEQTEDIISAIARKNNSRNGPERKRYSSSKKKIQIGMTCTMNYNTCQ